MILFIENFRSWLNQHQFKSNWLALFEFQANEMKLSVNVKGLRNLRQAGPSVTEDLDADEKGRGSTNTFEKLQPKKVAKDFYSRGVGDDHTLVDDEENKYDKLKTPKKIIFLLGLVCALAVLALFYPESHPVNDAELNHELAHDAAEAITSFSGTSRSLHNARPSCRKTGSSMRVELKLPGLGNSVSNCDLPKGASLLGLLQLKRHGEGLRIGLVNIDDDEQQNWHEFTLGWAKYYVFPFERAMNVQWSELFPEWINEEILRPNCPHLPMPSVKSQGEGPILLHAVIVRVLSCGRRDVSRLQALLAGATVASEAGGNAESMLILIISPCRPHVNLFPCDELLEQQDDLWLFQVSLDRLRQRLAMPVGSCELALQIASKPAADRVLSLPALKTGTDTHEVQTGSHLELIDSRRRREVYATLLHTDGTYICGAIVAAQSIRATGSQKDLIALVDENVTPEQREGLQQAGWELQDIERIRNPKSSPQKYNAWNYSKFRLWQMTQYDKIIYIDADVVVLQNLDFLFDMPEISATGNDRSLFNSGVMVVEPSNCTFNLLMDHIHDIESYNGGDQGYLNEIFPWWHRIPKGLNFLKHFWSNETEERDEKTNLFKTQDPPSLHVIHYLGRKPWLCYRDYDCNWNQGGYRKYASDVANKRWWEVHDSMPADLQKHCLLRTKQKATIEYSRRRAEAAGFEDEHWKINITDPRMHICTEPFCDWESMLKHWDDTQPTRRRLQF